jgi:hypothetical protein
MKSSGAIPPRKACDRLHIGRGAGNGRSPVRLSAGIAPSRNVPGFCPFKPLHRPRKHIVKLDFQMHDLYLFQKSPSIREC